MTSVSGLRSRLDAAVKRITKHRRDPAAQEVARARRLASGTFTNADVEQYLASQDSPVHVESLWWQWARADDEFRHRVGKEAPAVVLLVEVLNHSEEPAVRSAWLGRLLDLATTGAYQSEDGTTIAGTAQHKSDARVAWRLLADYFNEARQQTTTPGQNTE